MKKIYVSPQNLSATGDGIFKGWGTSLCWWANRVGHSEALTEKAAKLFFSAEGLNLNIMRYNIGGGDDPDHSHITRTDSMMPGFLEKDKETGELCWNYTADERQLRVLKACYDASGDDAFVEAFSNSPPYFMTISGCSSGHKRACCNNIRESEMQSFAEYLAHVCAYIQSELGIKIGSLAPMNEPYTPYWHAYSNKQEGCHVSPGRVQSRLLTETAEAMKKYNLNDIDLTASDETNSTLALTALKKLSPEALSKIDRISTHTYSKATPGLRKLCHKLRIPLWMTETDWSSCEGENPQEMGAGIWLSKKIIEDMNTLEPQAWVIWQIVASYISKDGYLGRKDMSELFDLNKGYWGCSVAEIDKEEYILTQKYYSFGQFTRYIRPGMKIIKTDKKSLAAYDEKEEKLVIAAVNDLDRSEELIFDFSAFGKDFSHAEAIRTSGNSEGGEKWAELDSISVTDGQLAVTLAPNSVTTFIIKK